MSCINMSQPRLTCPALITAAVAVFLTGCGSGARVARASHQMGERVQVGPLIYNVLEADWFDEIQAPTRARVPNARFLVIRITITNSGNKEVNVPLLNLEKADGSSFMELSEGEGVEEWIGVLRTVSPAETQSGRIVFDVRPGAYSLRLSDGSELERERTALVAIPLKLKESTPVAPVLGDPRQPPR